MWATDGAEGSKSLELPPNVIFELLNHDVIVHANNQLKLSALETENIFGFCSRDPVNTMSKCNHKCEPTSLETCRSLPQHLRLMLNQCDKKYSQLNRFISMAENLYLRRSRLIFVANAGEILRIRIRKEAVLQDRKNKFAKSVITAAT